MTDTFDKKPRGETHSGHRMRLRRRVREERLAGFEPHEVLELLLFYAIPRRDVNVDAHRLIDCFGTVDAVLHAPPEALMQVEGVGQTAARFLCRMGEALRAYEALTTQDRPLMATYAQARGYIEQRYKPALGDGQQTLLFLLNSHGRLIQSISLCDSLAWGEPDTLREALARILDTQAEGILLAEVIPDRPPLPEDYELTHLSELCATLQALDVRLWDLFLVGAQEIYSMQHHRDFESEPILREHTRHIREVYCPDEDDWKKD